MFVSRISRLESLRNVTAHQPAGRRAGCASENPAGGAATTPGQSHQPRRLLPGRLMESQVILSSRRVTSYYVNYSVVRPRLAADRTYTRAVAAEAGLGRGRGGGGPGTRSVCRSLPDTVSSGLTRLTDGWRCRRQSTLAGVGGEKTRAGASSTPAKGSGESSQFQFHTDRQDTMRIFHCGRTCPRI